MIIFAPRIIRPNIYRGSYNGKPDNDPPLFIWTEYLLYILIGGFLLLLLVMHVNE
jgi:hypothetical protein